MTDIKKSDSEKKLRELLKRLLSQQADFDEMESGFMSGSQDTNNLILLDRQLPGKYSSKKKDLDFAYVDSD